jgi:hypothetical protein
MWKNIVELDTTDDNKIVLMRFAGWIPKAANTHSEYVILIDFPPQHERASMLPYTYVYCLSCRRLKLIYGVGLCNDTIRMSQNSVFPVMRKMG